MQVDYRDEKQKLELAHRDMMEVVRTYNRKVENLSEDDISFLQLYFYFKKLDTLKYMSPKGHYWDDKRDHMIEERINLICQLGKKVFSECEDLDVLREKVTTIFQEKFSSIFQDFTREIKEAYQRHCFYVYTVLPIVGLSSLEASKHRENQYLNGIYDGVFATTNYEGILRYIARAVVGGMIVHGNEIHYPANPFKRIQKEYLVLLQPVSVYLSDVKDFEPQFDFDRIHDHPRFVFDGEWIAEKSSVSCQEVQVEFLPKSFIEINHIFYMSDKGEKRII